MTTMYNSSDAAAAAGEGGGSGAGGERGPPSARDITRALEETATVLAAPDKVGGGSKYI